MKKQIVLFISVALLFWQNAFCQSDALADLKSKLQSYNQALPSERLFVHTDKSFYTAGEIVWFKIYQLDTALNKSGIFSNVAYVEIVDEQNAAIAKAKIELDEKGGSGSLELPLTLNSGYYTLRAYTNWMKNFEPEQFFEKRITLINPLKSIDAGNTSISHGSIDLFPEGGNLVNGISSRIAFKILDNNGKGAYGQGYLLNEKNDTLLQFAPYKFGLGSFEFTPDLTHSYKAVFVFNDRKIIAKPLPTIYKEGYVMHVEGDDQKIKISVRSNIISDYPEMFLIVQNHQIVKAAKRNVLSNGAVNFSIDRSELDKGVSRLTVFNNEKQPVCERLLFVAPSQTAVLKTTASKESYNNREQVSLTITSTSPAPDLSLSVYQLDSLQTKDASDIRSYVWLESELNGKIEDPQYYLSGESAETKKASDLLMLTYGWRRFNWEQVLNESPSVKFFPEVSGHVITCKVEDGAGKPVKDVQVFLSIPETNYKLFSGLSNDSGIVKINAPGFYGKSEIVLQVRGQEDNYKIELLNPYSEQYAEVQYPSFTISTDKKTLLENYSIGMQAQHIYSADSIQRFSVPDIKDTFPFFGKALYTYKLDNYTRFTTMEEVLREYVREINVGVKGSGELKFKLFNEDYREFYTDNILVVVDGVPVFNTSKIFSIDPLKIRSLDIITKSYVLGRSIFYGLASFSTYGSNYEGVDIDPKAIRLNFEGLQLQREFYSPDYSTEQQHYSRIPDMRNTLFWSPGISINQPVKFYTGDNKGKYLVVIQGMDTNGQPLSSVSEIEVR